MDTQAVLSYLREKAYPAFRAPHFQEIPTVERRLAGAVLGSLRHDELAQLASALQEDSEAPQYLIEEVEWYMTRTPKGRAEHKNESIKQLLNWYSDKKSKKVSYAAEELKKRFSAQSLATQKTILKTFLCGSSKKEVEWAGRYLRDHWIPSFEGIILGKWHETKTPLLAYILLRHFSDTTIFDEREALTEVIGYSYVCARIGNMKGFIIDENRLDPVDWFYVMAKLGREDVSGQIDTRLKDCLMSLNPLDLLLIQDDNVLSVSPLGRVVWAMKTLHFTDGILRLFEMWDRAVAFSQKEDEDDRHYALLFSLQQQAEGKEENDEDYAQAKTDWSTARGDGPAFTDFDIDTSLEDLTF